jgi:DsbC/DsbD-like thiol-disulfide interchange protein
LKNELPGWFTYLSDPGEIGMALIIAGVIVIYAFSAVTAFRTARAPCPNKVRRPLPDQGHDIRYTVVK